MKVFLDKKSNIPEPQFRNTEASFHDIQSQGLSKFFDNVMHHSSDFMIEGKYEIVITDNDIAKIDIEKSQILQDQTYIIIVLAFHGLPTVLDKLKRSEIEIGFNLESFKLEKEDNMLIIQLEGTNDKLTEKSNYFRFKMMNKTKESFYNCLKQRIYVSVITKVSKITKVLSLKQQGFNQLCKYYLDSMKARVKIIKFKTTSYRNQFKLLIEHCCQQRRVSIGVDRCQIKTALGLVKLRISQKKKLKKASEQMKEIQQQKAMIKIKKSFNQSKIIKLRESISKTIYQYLVKKRLFNSIQAMYMKLMTLRYKFMMKSSLKYGLQKLESNRIKAIKRYINEQKIIANPIALQFGLVIMKMICSKKSLIGFTNNHETSMQHDSHRTNENGILYRECLDPMLCAYKIKKTAGLKLVYRSKIKSIFMMLSSNYLQKVSIANKLGRLSLINFFINRQSTKSIIWSQHKFFKSRLHQIAYKFMNNLKKDSAQNKLELLMKKQSILYYGLFKLANQTSKLKFKRLEINEKLSRLCWRFLQFRFFTFISALYLKKQKEKLITCRNLIALKKEEYRAISIIKAMTRLLTLTRSRSLRKFKQAQSNLKLDSFFRNKSYKESLKNLQVNAKIQTIIKLELAKQQHAFFKAVRSSISKTSRSKSLKVTYAYLSGWIRIRKLPLTIKGSLAHKEVTKKFYWKSLFILLKYVQSAARKTIDLHKRQYHARFSQALHEICFKNKLIGIKKQIRKGILAEAFRKLHLKNQNKVNHYRIKCSFFKFISNCKSKSSSKTHRNALIDHATRTIAFYKLFYKAKCMHAKTLFLEQGRSSLKVLTGQYFLKMFICVGKMKKLAEFVRHLAVIEKETDLRGKKQELFIILKVHSLKKKFKAKALAGFILKVTLKLTDSHITKSKINLTQCRNSMNQFLQKIKKVSGKKEITIKREKIEVANRANWLKSCFYLIKVNAKKAVMRKAQLCNVRFIFKWMIKSICNAKRLKYLFEKVGSQAKHKLLQNFFDCIRSSIVKKSEYNKESYLKEVFKMSFISRLRLIFFNQLELACKLKSSIAKYNHVLINKRLAFDKINIHRSKQYKFKLAKFLTKLNLFNYTKDTLIREAEKSKTFSNQHAFLVNRVFMSKIKLNANKSKNKRIIKKRACFQLLKEHLSQAFQLNKYLKESANVSQHSNNQ